MTSTLSELAYGIDFVLESSEELKQMIVKILKPDEYKEIKVKFNKITPKIDEKTDTLHLDITYDFVFLPKTLKEKKLRKNLEFQSLLGNIVYTILLINENAPQEEEQGDILDEIDGTKLRDPNFRESI